jgi:hypothetical protein
LAAAIDSRPFQCSIRCATSARAIATDSIPPCPDSARIAWLRKATTRAPSWSESPPATVAAAISPCECPITAAGSTP